MTTTSGTTAGSSRNRGPRRLVFVDLTGIKYGFATTEAAATHATILGHELYTTQAGVTFGVNSPKPNRASKRLSALRTISSFVDPANEDDAKAEGWRIVRKSSRRGAGSSAKTTTVYVDMPGVTWKYAWRMSTPEFTQHGAILGIQRATGAQTLVFGGNLKPPRARLIDETGSSISSFIAPSVSIIDKASAAGWFVSNISFDLIPTAATP